MDAHAPEPLLTIPQLAEYLGVPVETVYDLNKRAAGPPRLKLGHRTVRYRLTDVEAWLDACKVA